MKRTRTLLVTAISTAALAFAQDAPGWRRVGDPPPVPAAAPQSTAPPQSTTPQQDAARSIPDTQDPSQPVERDGYGQATQAPQMPRQNAPAMNRPAYGLPAHLTLKSGAYVSVRINQGLSTDHNRLGDSFTASLMQPVIIDGVVVSNRGQIVYGRVAELEKQKADHPSRLGLQLTSLTLADGTQAPITSQLTGMQGGHTPGEVQAGTVVGTTAVGAAVGGAVGWGTGAAIGAGVGAAAGLVGVMLTRHHPTVVYPETALTFQVTSPMTVSTLNAPQAFRYVGPEDYQQGVYAQQPTLRPRPGPGPYYAPYAPYAPAPYYYPYYPYWGPTVVIGGGWGWGGWGWRGGGYRRWR